MTDKPDVVPSTYVHDACGVVTQMPESVKSKYLLDPYFYSDGVTMCAQCGMVPDKACTWTDTGERLDVYMRRLQQQKGLPYHIVRWGIWVAFLAAGAILAPQLLKGGKGQIPAPWDSAIGVLVGVGAALFLGRFIRLGLCMLRII